MSKAFIQELFISPEWDEALKAALWESIRLELAEVDLLGEVPEEAFSFRYQERKEKIIPMAEKRYSTLGKRTVRRAALIAAILTLILAMSAAVIGITVTVNYNGKTAVLLEDAVLLNAYAGLTDQNDVITWTAVSETEKLNKGDIVLALKEKDGITMVYVFTGDTPMSLYGEVPSKCLSKRIRDIEKGNLAIADNFDIYSYKNGVSTGTISEMVRIINRDGGWCQIETFGAGGEEPQRFWVKREGLSYDFDGMVKGRQVTREDLQ